METPADLRSALEMALVGVPIRDLTAAVDRLITRYRSDEEVTEPILAGPADVAAYAAYRMPATYAAVFAALTQLRRRAPQWEPTTHLDLGGGTGAAAWAATHAFPSITQVTVVDQVAAALAFGSRLAANAGHAALRRAQWRQGRLDNPLDTDLSAAQLVTASYLLGELGAQERDAVVGRVAKIADLALIVEPGTPVGYGHVMAARARLIEAGFTVLAPCPHQDRCPLPPGRDWCHFAIRLGRSALHRHIKQAQLSYEDEKYSYVAASRLPPPGPMPAPARVIRRPQYAKGRVQLRLCTSDEGAVARTVAKSNTDLYRGARAVDWGDEWPPSE